MTTRERRVLRPPFLAPGLTLLVMVVVVVLGTAMARASNWMQRAEFAVYDVFVTAMSGERVNPHIALVEVHEDDIQRLGTWPVSDEVVANVLESIIGSGADVVGLDIYRDLSVPPGMPRLEEVLRENTQIFGVNKLAGADGDPGVAGPLGLEGTGRVGFADMVVDEDGAVRRSLLFASDESGTHTAFGVHLALTWLAQRGAVPLLDPADPAVLNLGGVSLPPIAAGSGGYGDADVAGYQMLLDFAGGPRAFPVFSLHDVLEGDLPDDTFDGRIVIVGVNAGSVKDEFTTPLVSARRSIGPTAGVALHGFLASQLIAAALDGRRPVRGLPGSMSWPWVAIWALFGVLCGHWARGSARAVGAVLGALLILGAVASAAYALRWWMPVAAAWMAWLTSAGFALAWAYAREKRDRDMLDQLFARQVSPEVADRLWSERESILESGRVTPRSLVCTSMFTDMAGFSTQAAGLGPEELMRWVSEYTDAMTELIMRYGGVIDDYAGDGIKASFGVPVPRTNEAEIAMDACRAAACALAMGGELERLAAHWAQTGLPATRVRVGLNTGPVIIGTIGSRNRMKFTTVGDSVNVAARLEGLDLGAEPAVAVPELDVRILVSGATHERLGDGFEIQALGPRALKGQPAPVETYLVLDGLRQVEALRKPSVAVTP